jgi:hypothetical protein
MHGRHRAGPTAMRFRSLRNELSLNADHEQGRQESQPKVSREMRQILRQRGDTTGGLSGCESQSGGGFAEKSAKLESLKPSRPPLSWIEVRFVPYFAAAKVTAMLSTLPCYQSDRR